ncbi:DUF3747 domain-containing protein [Trichothermofontia sp.]
MNSTSCVSPVSSVAASLLLSGILGSLAPSAVAATFEQQEVDQSKLIAIAAPVGSGQGYQLLILEQVADTRPCWQVAGSQPAIVDPLLLQFDFTGICSRSTDSNGYSVRLGGVDYGLQYSLRVQQRDNDLVLIATSFRGKGAPELEIGRAHGVHAGFVQLVLNPGWRFTKRAFEGKVLGHIYLTRDQSLQDVAQLSPPVPLVTAPVLPPTPAPLAVVPAPTVAPTVPVLLPANGGTIVPAPVGMAPPAELALTPVTSTAPVASSTTAPSALQEILAARAAIRAARSGAAPTQPGTAADATVPPAVPLAETDQPIIIPVPPPESGPIAPGIPSALSTGIGGPVTPQQMALANSQPSATPTITQPIPPTPTPVQAASEAVPLVAANLPTVRVAPTPGGVPPLATASPSVTAAPRPVMTPPPAASLPSRPPVSSPPVSSPSSPVTAAGFAYRLVAYADTAQAQNVVRSLAPDAFRVIYNGQVVWQAGLFRAHEINQARSLQQQLQQMNIQAVLLTAQ